MCVCMGLDEGADATPVAAWGMGGGACRYELPSAVALHHEPFSSENGLLLENKKPNRRAVEQQFAVGVHSRVLGLLCDQSPWRWW